MIKEQLHKLGIIQIKNIHRNLPIVKIVEYAIKRDEGTFSNSGALCVNTGKYTGRSPDDRFIVKDNYTHNNINWGNINKPISVEKFQLMYNKVTAYLQNKDIFVFDGYVGAHKNYALNVRIITERASLNLGANNLFIRPADNELANFIPDINVICIPDFLAIPKIDNTHSEAFIILNLKEKLILIGGTSYTGEIKKSVFSAMNYFLPFKNVFPMHCSANTDKQNRTCLFFGLSGTGKTTLSADTNRFLIGDDEHGWSDDGIFNFEGGCYAKTINLKKENELQIFNAIKFGTLLENVILDKNGNPDYANDSLTPNTRAAYPLEYIPNAIIPSIASHPRTILFLTADAFGVLPPISKLTHKQAMEQFVLGYTSKLAGTERGIIKPIMTFSMCFGAPFMILHPEKYAKMLKEKIEKFNTNVFLVNTGWIGGPYGVGQRINLKYTRRMVQAAIYNEFENIDFIKEEIFGFNIPLDCPDIPSEILNPINTWQDKQQYKSNAEDLASKFKKQLKKINVSF